MKTIAILFFVIAASSCNNANDSGNKNDTSNVTYDVTQADTTLQPNGMSNNEIISTDTAAYRLNHSKDSSK